MKLWKLLQVVGVLLLLVGVVWRIGGEAGGLGMPLALAGLGLYAIARIVTWMKSDQP